MFSAHRWFNLSSFKESNLSCLSTKMILWSCKSWWSYWSIIRCADLKSLGSLLRLRLDVWVLAPVFRDGLSLGVWILCLGLNSRCCVLLTVNFNDLWSLATNVVLRSRLPWWVILTTVLFLYLISLKTKFTYLARCSILFSVICVNFDSLRPELSYFSWRCVLFNINFLSLRCLTVLMILRCSQPRWSVTYLISRSYICSLRTKLTCSQRRSILVLLICFYKRCLYCKIVRFLKARWSGAIRHDRFLDFLLRIG